MTTCRSCDHENAADALFCARCGTPVETTEALAPGTMMGGGRYRIDSLLGVGGMGSVYKATDIGLQRIVALKLLNPELTAHPSARRRMLQEARILARIQHANVVQVRSVFEEEGNVLAMELEYMPGGDLLGMIPEGGMPEVDAIRIMTGVLAGLHALHEAGLVHRDVKPDNVLIAEDGTAKVTDLGVARDASAKEKTRLGVVLGTPEYMSPEQIQGLSVDRRSDLYSAGIMLYRMLTGDLPYQATSDFEWQVAHVQRRPDFEMLRGKGSDGIVRVVERALAKAPDERWRTAAEMSRALVSPALTEDGALVQVTAGQADMARLEAARGESAKRNGPTTSELSEVVRSAELAEATIDDPTIPILSQYSTSLSEKIALLSAATVVIVVIIEAVRTW